MLAGVDVPAFEGEDEARDAAWSESHSPAFAVCASPSGDSLPPFARALAFSGRQKFRVATASVHARSSQRFHDPHRSPVCIRGINTDFEAHKPSNSALPPPLLINALQKVVFSINLSINGLNHDLLIMNELQKLAGLIEIRTAVSLP